MDMNMQKYFAFVKTVEYSSFTKAAEVLSYSQSGISRMINDLEKEWGMELLERSKGGVRLTPAGKSILPYASTLCNEFMRLQAQVESMQGQESGLIRIGTFTSAAEHWLPPIIRAFQKDYPRIDYELLVSDSRDIERWILEGRVDCGFIDLSDVTPVDTIFLEQDRLLAVLPEDHPLADVDVFPITALMDSPFMLLKKDGNSEVTDFLDQYDIHPHVRFTTIDDYAVMAMVESGLGISVLPELVLRRTPYHIVAKPFDVPAYRNIALAMKDKKHPTPVVTLFMKYLDKRVKE